MDVALAKRTERPSWINLRTALGLILFLISLLSGSFVLRSAEAGAPVWAAARDLPEGGSIGPGDLESVTVDLPRSQLAAYLTSSSSLTDSVLLRPLRRGELVPAGWVTEASSGSTRLIAIPITEEHAVGGALRAGDRVDIFATLRAAGGSARTALLVQDAEVEGLLRSEALVVEGETFGGITLSVPPEEAARIAFAIRTAEIDVVRVEGPSGSQSAASVTARDI